jgi:hypothetical protein
MWLGETMAYTCAYYQSADATLEQAQIAKMDHVCRKLRLEQWRQRGGGRLRVGQSGVAHGKPLRRARACIQHFARADYIRARARHALPA